MGPPSYIYIYIYIYIRSVVDRNVVMRRMNVLILVNIVLTITPIHLILITNSLHEFCSKEAHAWYRHLTN